MPNKHTYCGLWRSLSPPPRNATHELTPPFNNPCPPGPPISRLPSRQLQRSRRPRANDSFWKRRLSATSPESRASGLTAAPRAAAAGGWRLAAPSSLGWMGSRCRHPREDMTRPADDRCNFRAELLLLFLLSTIFCIGSARFSCCTGDDVAQGGALSRGWGLVGCCKGKRAWI